MRIDAIISLRIDKVAVCYSSKLIRIGGASKLKDRLPCNAVAVCAVDSDRSAEIITEPVGNSCGRKVVVLGSQAKAAVTNFIVPFFSCLVVPSTVQIGVLRLFGSVIGNAIQSMALGCPADTER